MIARCSIPAIIMVDIEGKDEKAILRRLKSVARKLLEEQNPLVENDEVFEDAPARAANGRNMCVWPATGVVDIDDIIQE
jgi:hypothetical protein